MAIHIYLGGRSGGKSVAKDASFGIDDIAIGGTVIYKDGGSFKKAKAASKSGMRVKLDNGKEIHVGDVVSTDFSDWAKYQAKDAGFDKREYSPREFNRLQGEIDEVQAKIKTTKGPISKRDLEQVLAKRKAEQAKYKTDDAIMRRYNVEILLADKKTKKVEKLEFPAGKEGGYGGVIKYEIQKRYPGASVLGIVERGDSMQDSGSVNSSALKAELERLRNRMNAFTPSAPLAEKAKTSARIKEIEKELGTKDSVQSVEKEIANVKRFIAAFEKRGIPAHIGPSSSSWKRS